MDLSARFATSTTESPPAVQLIAKDKCPSFNHPSFWVNEKDSQAYAWGGEWSYLQPDFAPSVIPTEELWALTPGSELGGTWGKIEQGSDPVFLTLTRPIYGASTHGGPGGFYLGGKQGSHSSSKNPVSEGYVALPGLLVYNFTDGLWTNRSTSSLYGGGAWEQGGVQYVPTWGAQGLLVAFGGDDMSGYKFPWTNITVYDIAADRWYAQQATGDPPSGRELFCSVGIGSSSNDTYGKLSRIRTHHS